MKEIFEVFLQAKGYKSGTSDDLLTNNILLCTDVFILRK
jgi:hypothetical protein